MADRQLKERIESALDNIRPFMKADGGNVKLLDVTEEKIVILELTGNCGDCPMSEMTLKAGVEEAIKRNIPEIKGVRTIKDGEPKIQIK